jgi:signal transduction histidine kinase/ActR/RegA family two-component response regulator
MKEEFLTDGYAKITEFTNFSVDSFFVRKGYADILNNVHKRYKCSSSKSYVCNTNPLLELFLLLGAPLVNMELSFVKNPLIAIDAIRASGARKKKAEKKYTITESEIHSLISMVSLIAWDADAEKSLFKPDNPLRQIETALDLIKKDRQVIFSEIESKNNDLKTAIEELKKARDDAETAMTAKCQFLANMSHELRTPLNGVIGCTELLKETSLSGEQQSFLSIIHKSSVHLLAVINDILDYSKIESGQINLEKIPFDYASIIGDVVSIVYAQAIDKRIPVIVTVDKSLNKSLQGDPFRLKQILLNLLQNAIKFTNFGQIRIDIKVTSENVHSQYVTIDIIDTGIGIEDQKISQLFTQFVQADSSTTRKFGGTGLGLVIVKQLVELMNGTVSVRSSPGNGSTFSFVIPFIKTENSVAHFNNKTDSKFNIIILSQNDFEREWYEKNAIAYGGRILYCGGCFENGAETYSRRMVQQRDAICIVDPGFENADPAPLLKACLQAHEKVVYIKTTQGVQQAEQFKIDKVLTYIKPLKILDFQSILNSCIECDHFATTRNRVDSLLTDTRDKSGNTILLVEDSPTNQIVAKKLLEKIGYSNITICNNCREALQVLENNLFDLIFMDCQMPEIDGFEATEIIRSKQSNVKDHDIFIIAFTAHAMQEEIQKCFSVGMNDYILKPVTIDSLKTVLKRWSDARNLHHNIKPDLV